MHPANGRRGGQAGGQAGWAVRLATETLARATPARATLTRAMLARATLAAVAVMVLCAPAAMAQYPDRPIRLIHGFGAGGPADSISRIMAEALAKELKQPVVVEPRPGAGGNIGSEAVARAEPDGYTLGLVTGGHAVGGALYTKLPFHPVDSFQPVSTVVDYSFIVAVQPKAEYRTLKQLIAAAKAKPGSITFGSAGVGTTQHLTGELLSSMAGIQMVHVPYRGDAAAITALVGGDVQVIVAAPATVTPQAKAGVVRPIAVTTSERWSGMPDLPTVAESGIAGFDVRTWAGIVAPRGTPEAVVARLNAAIIAALEAPEAKAKLEAIVAGTARTRKPEEFREMLASEVARWNKVIDEAKIQRQ